VTGERGTGWDQKKRGAAKSEGARGYRNRAIGQRPGKDVKTGLINDNTLRRVDSFGKDKIWGGNIKSQI